ncbi:hypothetical protein [Polyangium sp. y55x31]|uniref:hypothetical protein n=1 Tax=Polyangium sp. y55x31 TaxID=3042688 RepID=UPI0024821E00|nr:hypothetical protein [Polyangium sp. y55x31]MDI1481183.1 hypothetical protein [Polyangium sp. y55x31]
MLEHFPSRLPSFRRVKPLAVVLLGVSSLACAPLLPSRTFHAPGAPSGRISATLVPAPGVRAGGPHLVTFGLPLPPESLTRADLSTVRILREGVEIPAHVDVLTPYRHITDPDRSGRWVRVARIQLTHTFQTSPPAPESVVVEWGTAECTRDVPDLVDPRRGFHSVTEGSFAPEDLVTEPEVYVVLPKSLLSQGALRTPFVPLDDRVGEEMDPPALLYGQRLPWPLVYDFAQKNYFYGLLNEPVGDNPYRTNLDNNGEAWLYDRASAMFVLYLRGGSARVLREAVRASVFYERLLVLARQHRGDPSANARHQAAFFSWRKPRPDPKDAAKEPTWDPKYSYVECLALMHWLTGDERILDKLDAVVAAFADVPSRWSPAYLPVRKSTGERMREAWTERHVAFKLLAATIAFELRGREEDRARVVRIVEDLLWHQDQSRPGGLFARVGKVVDGGLYHFGTQHDPDEAGEELVASPWMSALLVDAMVRVHSSWEDPRIARFIVRMGNMLAAASKVRAQPDGARRATPDYLIRPDGSTHTDHDGAAHAADVMGALAWADAFARLLGEPEPRFRRVVLGSPGLYETFAGELFQSPDDWMLRPYRRYAWMFRTSAAFSYALGAR